MSFKRDGDDQSQLNLLKKRRVSDLLAEDIPEDEAFLMRCGRYACIVCHYRPVFDTIATLLVHRSGKKHLNSLKKYYAKRRDLMREVEKRKQIQYLRNEEEGGVIPNQVEDASPLLTQTRKATHHALLTSVPYKGYKSTSVTLQEHKNSEKKRSLFQRAFGNSHQRDQGDVELPSATQTQALPGNGGSSNNSKSQETSCSDDTRDKASVGQDEDGNIAKYDCQQGNKKQSDNSFTPRTSVVPLTLTEKRQPATFQLKPYIPKNQRNRQDQTGELRQSKMTIVPAAENVDVPKDPIYFESYPMNDVSQQIVGTPDGGELKQTASIPSRNGPIHGKKVKKRSRHHKAANKVLEDAKSREREQYFKMTSSGWKSDWNGGWVKDEDVEFDSDEDETPLINN